MDSGMPWSWTKAKENAPRIGAVEHLVIDIDLRQIGGSALTADIEVPKGRDLDRRHPGHLRARPQHHLSLLCPRLGRGARRL